MWQLHFLADLADVAVWLGLVIPVLFCIQYTMLAKWWKNPVGRSIVALDFCLFVVFLFSAIGLAFPHWSFLGTLPYTWIAAIAILGVPLVAAYRMVVWERMRRARKHAHMTDDGVK